MRNFKAPSGRLDNRRRIAAARAFVVGWLLVGGASFLALSGCSSPPPFEFDELDVAPVQEELSEFSLGQYRIPIPVTEYVADKPPKPRNRFQLEFELFALVAPRDKSHVTGAWELHQRKMRDRVIRICRSASLEELQEPELVTLKARLMDALTPQLGEEEVRQLLITEIVSQQISKEPQSEPESEPEHGGGH